MTSWWVWLRGGGVRLRSAIAAAAVVGVAGVVVALSFASATEAILTHNVDSTARQRAAEVTAGLRADDGSDLDETLTGDRTLVQVLDYTGAVRASSIAGRPQPPLTRNRPPAGHSAWESSPWPVTNGDTYRILAVGVPTRAGPRIVVVAQSLAPVQDAAEAMTRTLLVGMPVLILVVGLATFFFVGRSLRPVEAIRRRVALITARDLHSRVPLPPGRDEVAALAATMNAMLDRLEAASVAQRRFLADASHELRSPLATVLVGLDYLAKRATSETGLTQVQLLQGEAERLGRLVADLLLLTRADEHALTVRHDDVDLDDLVFAERERFAAQYPAVRFRARVDPVRVAGDPAGLQRALRNLLDNAARHAESRVTVAAWADGEAHLVVADDGHGIAADDRQRIFERFVRLDAARARQDGGTGLGLAISREIVAGHGGRIAVDGDLDLDHGWGAVFHIRLPLPVDAAPARAHPPSAASR
jgi:signal transduction histidine kinase